MTGDPLTVLREAATGWPQPNSIDEAVDAVEALIEASRAADGVIYALPRAVRTKRRQAVGTRLNRALARFPATSPAKEQA